MTASTAPITLPARHRTAAPIWNVHVTFAWVAYWWLVAVWTVRSFPAEHGREHTAGVVAVLVLIATALAAAVGLR